MARFESLENELFVITEINRDLEKKKHEELMHLYLRVESLE